MASKPFLTDVKALRERARQHIEQGAVTPGYSADQKTVVRILNDMARKLETAIIVVTHDEKIIPTFKRIYHIRDGVTHEEVGEGRGFE